MKKESNSVYFFSWLGAFFILDYASSFPKILTTTKNAEAKFTFVQVNTLDKNNLPTDVTQT